MQDKLLYIGLAGQITHFDKVLIYLHTADWSVEQKFDSSTGAIIVGEKYVYTMDDDNGYLARFPRNTKLAEGSGCYFAQSAMALGMNAIDAIKHAISLDSASGGKVQHVRIKKAVGKRTEVI